MAALTSKNTLGAGAVILVVAAIVWMGPWQQRSHKVSYNEDIRPILNKNCLVCHGGVRRASGFSLLFASDAMEPNESGKPAYIPGHPDSSELMVRLTHHDPEARMPLENPALSDEEIDLIRQWIKQGAQWETHWAYQKPISHDPPHPRRASWARNPIDQFTLAAMEAQKLKPAPEASCTTLIRRLSLDLTGLPPSPEDTRAFCDNRAPDAYEQVVDRLLAAPAFGERWAAMWLDLARYADTKGYEKDGARTIWKYRDWVIDAFNRDLPFDQFTIEQLAGDLLPNPSEDQLIATAFHRNTMNNDEGGTDDEEFRVASVVDRVNTTWEVWMGTTMACVQCHSHPYDPFRQEEYYEFFAFFNNSADADRPDEHPTLESFADSQLAGLVEAMEAVAKLEGGKVPQEGSWSERRQHVLYPGDLIQASHYAEAHNAESESVLISLRGGSWIQHDDIGLAGKEAITLHYAVPGNESVGLTIRAGSPSGKVLARAQVPPTGGWGNFKSLRIPIAPVDSTQALYMQVGTQGENPLIRLKWFALHDQLRLSNADRTALMKLREELEGIPSIVQTPIMRELPEKDRRRTHMFNRGNFLDPLQEVLADVPEVMPPLPAEGERNRLTLAKWIVSADNPLTSRVIVNRFWEQLFGRGLVFTTEDFGTQGFAPSHPALLDWLADGFIHRHEWSTKGMLKEIVMSATYRQRSEVSPAALEQDPDNIWLARAPRLRLGAEQIRDQALAVSGLMSDKQFGPSVMPYQPDGIWRQPYSAAKWEVSEGEDQYRRGLYTYWRRSAPYPSMVTFDSPSREFCVSRRITTNTPLQALVTLNDPVYVEAASALATRMIDEAGENLDDQIRRGFWLALSREPSLDELGVLQELYREAFFHYRDQNDAAIDAEPADTPAGLEQEALTVVANTIMNLDEFITRG